MALVQLAMTRERWMALFFALGSTCFLIGPFPGYAQLVGGRADAVTFFIGSLLFTAGGAVQTLIAFPERRSPERGRAAWWTAAVQSAGTLFFNVTTYQALHTALSNPSYDRLVWRPDAFGSICFLVSGAIAYRASARHGWLPARGRAGWWEPAINLLGCIFFGISAVAGTWFPRPARWSTSRRRTGTPRSERRASWPALWPRWLPAARQSRRGCAVCTSWSAMWSGSLTH